MSMIFMDVDTALAEVPVNAIPLIDDTDFKTVETAIAYNAAGMSLEWHFVSSAGAYTVTSVTPTTAGTYDWAHQGKGMYSIEIPATGGASINNDTEGYGWFAGTITGVLPFRGPTICFRSAAINDALCDGGDLLDVNTTQVAGQTASATAGVDFDDLATVEAVTTAIGATGSGLSGIPAVTVGTNNDKTGYSLTPTTGLGNQTANITGNLSGSVGSVTGNVDGNVSGSAGSISGVTFPTNFAALGINVSGHISRVTLVDTTTTNTDMRGTDSALLAASAPTNFSDLAITATTGYVSVGSVGVNAVTGPDDFKADVSGLATASAMTTAQNDLDILTGTDGATLSTASTTAIGTAFLSTALTKGTAGTIERAFWQILKTQAVTDGTAVADASNTTTTFYTDLTTADGVYDHMIILFISNGLEGEARPIDTYVQTNGVITLQEPLTTAPTGDEEFIILPQHAHPISEIQNGLATSTALQTAQDDLDILTGTDGVTLATVQGNYAPAKAGDQMDLVDAPNATAVTAFQNGLALASKLLNYVRLLARKDSAVATDLATELGEINADTGTGTGAYSNNDALESIRDNASGLDAAGVRAAVGLAAANLDTQLGAIAGDTGSGANSITPTVTDGTDPLESAKVRFTKGAESYLQSTNASGTFSTPFALDNGTWTVTITLPGYTFSTTTLVVTGNATPTYAMTATGLSVPESPRIRARLLVLDATTKLGLPEVSLTVTVVGAAAAAGYGSRVTSRTITSDANGLAEWYALPGEDYAVTGPSGTEYTIRIPSTATDPHSLTSILI